MPLPNINKYGLVENPLVVSPYTKKQSSNQPHLLQNFELMNGQDFLLMDGQNFLLLI